MAEANTTVEVPPTVTPPATAAAQRFGALLRSYRERLNLTQREMAELIGTDYSTLSKWEHGKRKPPRGTAFYRSLRNAGLSEAEIADLLRTDDAPPWLVPDREVAEVVEDRKQPFGDPIAVSAGGFHVRLEAFADPDVAQSGEAEVLEQLIRAQVTLTIHEFLRKKLSVKSLVEEAMSIQQNQQQNGRRGGELSP